MNDQDQRTDKGEDVLTALASGTDIPAIREDALSQARVLFGPDAALSIEGVHGIRTATTERGSGYTSFCAQVTVRCTDGDAG